MTPSQRLNVLRRPPDRQKTTQNCEAELSAGASPCARRQPWPVSGAAEVCRSQGGGRLLAFVREPPPPVEVGRRSTRTEETPPPVAAVLAPALGHSQSYHRRPLPKNHHREHLSRAQ
uniref:Uncharacterized protein n=1 Tax=Eutreptiella gymnastica TaxID=73025 RepID=A0A7S4GC03_9EUGL